MRFLLYLLIIICFSIGCSNDDDRIIEEPEADVYKIENMEFYLSEDDTLYSVIDRLDTITYVNRSTIQLPDTTFYPYKSLKDSLFIELDMPIQEELSLQDSLGFQRMIIRNDRRVGYVVSQDSTYISKFPSSSLLPLHNVNVNVIFTPNPNTKYEITGAYWRDRYSISFRAEAINIKNQEPISLSGKLRYSTVRTWSEGVPDEDIPMITTLLASEVE